MTTQQFDREINPGDIADFLAKGLLENLVLLFRAERGLYSHLPALLTDERIGVRIGTSALVESLGEEDPEGRPRAAAELAGLLNNGNGVVRGDAAYLLGLVGCRDDADRLRPLLQDENADVREAAEEALEQISKRPC